ncbi:hypothetical protein EBO15_29520 [Actinomadura harenae]|uniref:Secreted protein n=1 Tax=Actinomadura harenae TaxID=2483351 RepID=A0A3M2LPW5_9ACTN|nr:hypothetical protein EBO15_29520 [Actinomadura harenae]
MRLVCLMTRTLTCSLMSRSLWSCSFLASSEGSQSSSKADSSISNQSEVFCFRSFSVRAMRPCISCSTSLVRRTVSRTARAYASVWRGTGMKCAMYALITKAFFS